MSSTASSTGGELLGPARLHVAHHVDGDLVEPLPTGAVGRHPAAGASGPNAGPRIPRAAAVPTCCLHRPRAYGDRPRGVVASRPWVSSVAVRAPPAGGPPSTTLTYVYADQTAVVGPLATYAEPHAYDLCDRHSERLSAPRGWEVLRLANDDLQGPSSDDLLALADAVREAAQPRPVEVPLPPGRRRPRAPVAATCTRCAPRTDVRAC